jgi:hypothetical protein
MAAAMVDLGRAVHPGLVAVPLLLYHRTGTPKDAKLKAITDTRTALLAG